MINQKEILADFKNIIDPKEVWLKLFGCPLRNKCQEWRNTANPTYWKKNLCAKNYRKCIFWWSKKQKTKVRKTPWDEIWKH